MSVAVPFLAVAGISFVESLRRNNVNRSPETSSHKAQSNLPAPQNSSSKELHKAR